MLGPTAGPGTRRSWGGAVGDDSGVGGGLSHCHAHSASTATPTASNPVYLMAAWASPALQALVLSSVKWASIPPGWGLVLGASYPHTLDLVEGCV